MKRLILVRHAKTERRAESGEDFDRALTQEGRHAAVALARALAAAGLIPDLALVSAALRTRQTFELMRPSLPDVHERVTRALYDAPAESLKREAEEAPGDTVMLVAHNPGVQSLAVSFVEAAAAAAVKDRQALAEGFPPANAAAFEFLDGRVACLGVFRPEPSA